MNGLKSDTSAMSFISPLVAVGLFKISQLVVYRGDWWRKGWKNHRCCWLSLQILGGKVLWKWMGT